MPLSRARLTARKSRPTMGQGDAYAPIREGDGWRGVSALVCRFDDDRDWFSANPHRRMRLRLSIEIEDRRQNSEPGLVFVVRSRHDRLWNTVALRVCACPAFAVPDFADDDAAALYVAPLNFRTMLDAVFLARGGSRFVSNALSLFDSGAQEFRA